MVDRARFELATSSSLVGPPVRNLCQGSDLSPRGFTSEGTSGLIYRPTGVHKTCSALCRELRLKELWSETVNIQKWLLLPVFRFVEHWTRLDLLQYTLAIPSLLYQILRFHTDCPLHKNHSNTIFSQRCNACLISDSCTYYSISSRFKQEMLWSRFNSVE